MLKKVNRLKSQSDFKRTLSGKRLCINDCFVLYGLTAPLNTAGPFLADHTQQQPVAGSSVPVMQPRIGFIVSKKVHKRSVCRNRVKRRFRELVRTCLLSENRARLTKYRTLVFVARGNSVETPFQRLRLKMEHCFQQL